MWVQRYPLQRPLRTHVHCFAMKGGGFSIYPPTFDQIYFYKSMYCIIDGNWNWFSEKSNQNIHWGQTPTQPTNSCGDFIVLGHSNWLDSQCANAARFSQSIETLEVKKFPVRPSFTLFIPLVSFVVLAGLRISFPFTICCSVHWAGNSIWFLSLKMSLDHVSAVVRTVSAHQYSTFFVYVM